MSIICLICRHVCLTCIAGCHTNNIEARWNIVKVSFKRRFGMERHLLAGYLDEAMWRSRHPMNVFGNVIAAIKQQYPLYCKAGCWLRCIGTQQLRDTGVYITESPVSMPVLLQRWLKNGVSGTFRHGFPVLHRRSATVGYLSHGLPALYQHRTDIAIM